MRLKLGLKSVSSLFRWPIIQFYPGLTGCMLAAVPPLRLNSDPDLSPSVPKRSISPRYPGPSVSTAYPVTVCHPTPARLDTKQSKCQFECQFCCRYRRNRIHLYLRSMTEIVTGHEIRSRSVITPPAAPDRRPQAAVGVGLCGRRPTFPSPQPTLRRAGGPRPVAAGVCGTKEAGRRRRRSADQGSTQAARHA